MTTTKQFAVYYTELIEVASNDYPMLNCGYDNRPCQTVIAANNKDEILEQFAGLENITLDLIEEIY